jgi:CRP-like cAMP-binding protein
MEQAPPTSELFLKVENGNYVFRQGDPGDSMYIIMSGRVEIIAEREGVEESIGVLSEGSIFGEMGVFEQVPRSASSKVVEDCTLLRIDSKVFTTMVQDNIEAVQMLLSVINTRLRHTNERLFELNKVVRGLIINLFLLKSAAQHFFTETRPFKLSFVQLCEAVGMGQKEVENLIRNLLERNLLFQKGPDLVIEDKTQFLRFAASQYESCTQALSAGS